jgi:hypothetical protein
LSDNNPLEPLPIIIEFELKLNDETNFVSSLEQVSQSKFELRDEVKVTVGQSYEFAFKVFDAADQSMLRTLEKGSVTVPADGKLRFELQID